MPISGVGLSADLSELSGLPRYKVAKMMTFLVRVIQYECARGGTVALPNLGVFRGQTMHAKTLKNVIAGRGNGTILRKTMNLPPRRKLVFVPKDNKKWLPYNPPRPVP